MGFKELYRADLFRYGKIESYHKCLHFFLRKSQTCKNVLKHWYRFVLSRLENKRGIEISYKTNIGKGLYLGHAHNITVNPDVVIGDNCNLHKGVTIGQENRGKRKGSPKIGNKVWIGVNATIVGNVVIGNDVLIAPNSYVNCDIPDHSVVFGNPCVIKHRPDATEGYINHIA